MKSRFFALITMLLVIIPTPRGLSQGPSAPTSSAAPYLTASLSDSPIQPSQAFSSSSLGSEYTAGGEEIGGEETAAGTAAYIRPVPSNTVAPKTFRPFSRIGIDTHTGLAGAGFDIATPLARKFNLRAGSDFFNYSDTFQEQGANVAINLHLLSGHASLDWFPFGGRFRLSPQMVFANNNHVLATAVIPSGSNISLNGQSYISSPTDPLQGSGSVEFRKLSPGFTLGFGNIIPRTKSHLSVPIEVGFYYADQPALKVNFSGSGCDPTQPPSIGCQSVVQDASFQQNLSAFTARMNNNLTYASFFPVLSVGFGYAF